MQVGFLPKLRLRKFRRGKKPNQRRGSFRDRRWERVRDRVEIFVCHDNHSSLLRSFKQRRGSLRVPCNSFHWIEKQIALAVMDGASRLVRALQLKAIIRVRQL